MEWRLVNKNMDLSQEREPPMPVCFKNVDGKVLRRSKRATLSILRPRESLRQGSAEKAMVVYEEIRNSGKVCATCTGYVQGKQNSGEMCNRNYRKFQD